MTATVESRFMQDRRTTRYLRGMVPQDEPSTILVDGRTFLVELGSWCGPDFRRIITDGLHTIPEDPRLGGRGVLYVQPVPDSDPLRTDYVYVKYRVHRLGPDARISQAEYMGAAYDVTRKYLADGSWWSDYGEDVDAYESRHLRDLRVPEGVAPPVIRAAWHDGAWRWE